MMGNKVRWVSAGTRDEVSFSFPQVQPGGASCELCCQGFANVRSFKKYMRIHPGDTGYSWEDFSKVLASRVMPDLRLQNRGQEMQLHCIECVRGYTTKQALVAHLRARHGSPPALGELLYVLCAKKGFQSAEDHEGTHGLSQGAFSMLGGWPHCWSFFFSGHLAEKHGSSSCCEQWGCLLYVCTGPSMVTIVVDCLGKLGGGGNQATGQVTSHLLLTPILIVLVTCHWVVLVACHWVVLVAYSHSWVLALFLNAAG